MTVTAVELKALEERVSRLYDQAKFDEGKRGQLADVCERIRRALRVREPGGDVGALQHAAEILQGIIRGDPHDFGPSPEADVYALADVLELLTPVVDELAIIQVS